ncbi:hypothetical protein QAD02_023647 [Eretmocerus hayati]|uniref:Uncharacterized protein n=1 Tax=Eretmocerus hayati TaxID=131215 RepID=A0ACC2PZU2_9HYME|nr:hypothetical protein QAD02_023647 [Eretmocerus hayati]
MRPARSDPDFRAQHQVRSRETQSQLGAHYQYPLQQQQLMKRESRMRSASEANLLSTPSGTINAMTSHRHSIAPIDPGLLYAERQTPHETMEPPQQLIQNQMQHPHLQLRAVEAVGPTAKNGSAYLRGLSLEAGAGDIFAVMSTVEREGTLIMETISGRIKIRRGDILLNGRSVTPKILRSTVSYLSADTPEAGLLPELTSLQCLSFYRLLRGAPGLSGHELEAILQELGLDATKHCLVSSLTCSEARRLALACRLIEGTQILCLDRPSRGLDIFDTFFLVEYLRQWALRAQRLVLLTLHPPTYEILTMLTRLALTSHGRCMYTGPRRDMIPYFALADFPCPPFKNPSDYYLDLVTLDDLSAEAMLESSQRIEHLAELARIRLPGPSDPGPPGALPLSNFGAGPLGQLYALLFREIVYRQPRALANLFRNILLAIALGLAGGATFWNVSEEAQLQLRDRAGFHYASFGVLFWPLSLLGVAQVLHSRSQVECDLRHGIYYRFVHIVVELLCSLPSWAVVYLCYLGPGYAMTGLHLAPSTSRISVGPQDIVGAPSGGTMVMPDDGLDSLWRFLRIGLTILLLQHYVCLFFAKLLPTSWSPLILLMCGVTLSSWILGAGFTLHPDNVYPWYVRSSPLRWALKLLLPPLHSSSTLGRIKNCRARQVQQQDIITQSACDGELALREMGLGTPTDALADIDVETWLQIALGVAILVVMFVSLIVRHTGVRQTLSSKPNKP